MYNNHVSGVVNALLNNLTNTMAERLNGKIQELKTVGRGYQHLKTLEAQYYSFLVD
ncbi:transposase [Algoriphagus persicinus]|uniref:transposase n=1 Tax=Algoriphagus persicinus TaxID=3108754 RepID=UPI002B3BB41D|nr:transposase [Algoriphagus sp. E1-3-M2]MEB2783157.1 transposase [Algoriphagus sp. E1-3-M2]